MVAQYVVTTDRYSSDYGESAQTFPPSFAGLRQLFPKLGFFLISFTNSLLLFYFLMTVEGHPDSAFASDRRRNHDDTGTTNNAEPSTPSFHNLFLPFPLIPQTNR